MRSLLHSQIIPHLTNEVQDWIERVSKLPVDETDEEPDVCIIEVSARAMYSSEPLPGADILLSHDCSLVEPLETLSLPRSSRRCDSSNSESDTRTLPSCTCP